MTESDWLTSTDPQAMLYVVQGPPPEYGGFPTRKASDRQLRLWAVACCRAVWPLLADNAACPSCVEVAGAYPPEMQGALFTGCQTCGGTGRVNRSQRAVEVAERYADGAATEQELVEAAGNAYDAMSKMALYEFGPEAAAAEAFALCRVDIREGIEVGILTDPRGDQQAQAALLREIVGNPRRPVSWEWCHAGARETLPGERYPPSKWWRPRWVQFGPPWESALALARSAYESRVDVKCRWCRGTGDYEGRRAGGRKSCPDCHGSGVAFHGALDPATLGILADALDEAGCTDEAILRHLRAPGPHVRGCWAVDALRGKE